jgi:hypothetical protein
MASEEAERLTPIFEAASAIIPRCGRNHLNAPEDLKRLFRNSARICGSMMLNEPILLQEGFAYEASGLSESISDELEAEYSARNEKNRQFHISFMNIEGNYSAKRMFHTGIFGFLTVKRTSENEKTSFVVPMITLPKEISRLLKEDRNKTILNRFTDLNYLTNHDWLHSIYADAINGTITKASYKAEVKHTEQRVRNGFDDNHFLKPITHTANDDFESFHMRFHADVLTHMASHTDNALEAAVNNYMSAWKEFTRNTNTYGYMQDPAFTTPARFALRMLAFNLVRAVPYEHPIVQNILNDKDVGHDRIVIDKMYQSLMTGIIFGNGQNKKGRTKPIPERTERKSYNKLERTLTTRKYGLAVKHTVSRAFKAADEDAIEALGLEVARPRTDITPKQLQRHLKRIRHRS